MTALIVVDVQHDFLPGGSLAVESGDEVVPVINQLMEKPFDRIVASRDWHPSNHGSFAANHPGKKPRDKIQMEGLEQILWPVHCVQNTYGAEFHAVLNTGKIEKVFDKGTDPKIDSYSCFFDNGHKKATGLGDYLKENGIHTVYLAGLTTDYCVKFSALDALELGFIVYVVEDACKAVNLEEGDDEKALEELKEAGAEVIRSGAVSIA